VAGLLGVRPPDVSGIVCQIFSQLGTQFVEDQTWSKKKIYKRKLIMRSGIVVREWGLP